MMTSESTPAGPDLAAISRSYEAEILAAAKADPRCPGGDLRVLHEEAFRSETEGNPVCFMVIGEAGMIGVSAPVNPDGSLGAFVCVPL